MAYQLNCLLDVIRRFAWYVADQVDGQVYTDIPDQFAGPFDLFRSDALAKQFQYPWRSGFDAELNAFTSGAFHHDQQLFINCVDTGLAIPEDVGIIVDQLGTELDSPFAIRSKRIIPD